METTLAPIAQPAHNPALMAPTSRPIALVMNRPQARVSAETLWAYFRRSKAWGEALEMYDLDGCE